jgi:hypothetical protein
MTLSEREREREKVTEKERERQYKLKGIINVPTIDSEQSKSFSYHLFHFD